MRNSYTLTPLAKRAVVLVGRQWLGTGHVVAGGDRGMGADEHGAGVGQPGQHGVGVGHLQVDVLGGEPVGQRDQAVHIVADDQGRVVAERLLQRGHSRAVLHLHRDLGGDGVGELAARREQEAAAGVVLGLGDQVGGDERGHAGVVGDDEDFAGPEEAVGADGPGHLALGQLHVDVAGADDLVDAGDGGRAERHGRDGCRAADAVDVLELQLVGGGQHEVAAAVGAGRRGDDHARHAGGHGGHGQHDQAGRVGRLAAGEVEPGRVDRREADAQLDARPHQRRRRRRADVLLVFPDLRDRPPDGRHLLGRHAGGCGGHLVGADPQHVGREVGEVEPPGDLDQRLVPTRGHVGHDLADDRRLGGVPAVAGQLADVEPQVVEHRVDPAAVVGTGEEQRRNHRRDRSRRPAAGERGGTVGRGWNLRSAVSIYGSEDTDMSEAHVQGLESRRLTSAVTATLSADQATVRADLLRFRADLLGSSATLRRETVAFKHGNLAAATTVASLVEKFRADLTAMRTTLKGDRLDQSKVVLVDRAAVLYDLRKLRVDRRDVDAVAADRSRLRTDAAKLEADVVAGISTRIGARTTLFDDVTAIATAADGDANASADLRASVHQFATDWTSRLSTLTADLTAAAG